MNNRIVYPSKATVNEDFTSKGNLKKYFFHTFTSP